MLSKTKAFIKYCFSFVLPIKAATFISHINGQLTVWYSNGRYILNAKDVNYSYDSLHHIFRQIFKKINLKLSPSDTVLLLGLGSGSVVNILHKELKFDSKITAVEIDPLILSIAKKYFGIDEYKRLNIVIADALDYIKSEKEKYDFIVVDLFINDRVPEKFLNIDFINPLCSTTSKNGCIIFNMIVANKKQRRENETVYELFKNYGGSVSRITLMSTNWLMVWQNV